tara:strand:+ start:390 stop:926 length:537 start_codon:yes stop_codon:yes gene_type:complete
MNVMSWQCAEGPYGRYPGEEGYEEDLERDTIERIDRGMLENGEKAALAFILKSTRMGHKSTWIRTTDGQLKYGDMGLYISAKLGGTQRNIIKLHRADHLGERKDTDQCDRFILCSQYASISSYFKLEYILLSVDIPVEHERIEELLHGIRQQVHHMVVFSASLPPASWAPEYRVLDLT